MLFTDKFWTLKQVVLFLCILMWLVHIVFFFPLTHMASAQQGNIQRLTVRQLDSYKADTWILSPPCQPYTRQGDFGQFVQVFHFTDWLLEQACLSSLETRPHSCYNGSFITSVGKVRAALMMMTKLSVMIFYFLSLFLMYEVPQIL